MFFVRSASVRDIPAIRDVLAETWRATYAPFYGAAKVEEIIADWHSEAAIKASLERPLSEFLVADDGKTIAGVAFASYAADTKAVSLHQLYVRPACQGLGVGRDLFAEIETCFPDARSLTLEVDPGNEPAIAFYQAHGMAETGRTDNCGKGQSGIPALILSKPLAG
ncbi:MAG: GNAT family N-acetyltransferase [Hoeflea sp.]|uniref:GNAT family N-acetyltransferase n=1 Tax=Hoeflea sp. TaxID=1940281 RepID=UPI001D9744D4|nr:GNAT family N-acetyltransferase [Hoeflea sp.]MBU4528514.1 GNAT family N-acetyltransferase [Alphaproteobacteria bacterium]MBU4542387.1 GNAT family N-acetyltransferase [Alphaproteobacteria bacterium]MBU4550124.1 GNAT family N-acetyltransferase [Alphaproteobacteria bacterium]MBV1726118.1 GNAT family N-acetyltransferase [Hoeflea sp.]MBV1762728.1 GNAT family N-acetyltransferase [Hoeflea sp.]